jgi:copper transport protein
MPRLAVALAARVRWASLLLLLALALPSAAHAHTKLSRSTPAAGGRLTTAPRELRLTFSEKVELALARVRLFGPAGDTVELSALRNGGDSAQVIVAAVPPLRDAGSYRVEWQVAGRDGHPVRGRFAFEVLPGAAGLVPAAAAQAAPREPVQAVSSPAELPEPSQTSEAGSPLRVALRWATYAAVIALAGAAVLALVVLPRAGLAAEASARRSYLAGVALVASLALAACVTARLVVQRSDLDGDVSLADILTRTLWGAGWMLLAAATIAALAGALAWRAGKRGATAVIGATVIVAVGLALSGHAAGAPRYVPLLIAADAVHVLAAAGWMGTLAVMAPLLARVASGAGEAGGAPAVARIVRAFSPVALLCASAAALTGVLAAWVHLGSIANLLSSGYGAALLWKLALVGAAAAIGAYNWRVATPRLDAGDALALRRSAMLEVAAGALILAATAVLVATPPPG